MRESRATVIENYYDAWNRHDDAALAASFAEGGVYADPLTRVDISGDDLTDHVQNVLDVIRDLRISLTHTSRTKATRRLAGESKAPGTASSVCLLPRQRLCSSRGRTSSSWATAVFRWRGVRSISWP
jgi:hypothetical protein